MSQRQIFEGASLELERQSARLLALQKRSASARQVLRPSDDPIAVGRIVEMKAHLAGVGPSLRNGGYVASWLSVTESSLGQMNEVLTRAKELAVSQASDTASAETRRMTAQEVRELYDQLVQLANARLGERYVFGGTRTLGPPVARDGAYNPLLSGNGEEMAVRVHGGDTVVMNITALEALEAGGTLETLRDLITALEGNDRSAVADGLTGLDRGMEAVNRCLAAVGGRTNGLDHAAAALQAAELDLREAVSGYEDADMAQTLTELLSQQTVYEAALRTTSIIMNRIRLMDLLG